MKHIFMLILILLPPTAFAGSADLGSAASNVNEVISFIYDIIDVVLYMGAAVMATSGIMKFRLHRRNPQQMPLGTPITELSIAGVLILLAVMVQLSESHQTVGEYGSQPIYRQSPATGSGELRPQQSTQPYRVPQSQPQQQPRY